MDEVLLRAENVGFAYRRPVLQDFSLVLPPGVITLLVGLNGAGKTTALGILAGEKPPADGQVRVFGADPRRPRARRHLFFLREEAAPPSQLTASEAVRFYADLYGRARLSRAAVESLLDRFGLRDVARRRAATFSKGMQRRLELACLMAVDPEIWLLDEPQAGLDPLGIRILRELCTEARSRGRALVIASHALGDIPALADTVIVLRQGRTVFAGARAELMERVGARSFVVKGAGPGFDGDLAALARRSGAELHGPEIPAGSIEDLLFRDAGP